MNVLFRLRQALIPDRGRRLAGEAVRQRRLRRSRYVERRMVRVVGGRRQAMRNTSCPTCEQSTTRTASRLFVGWKPWGPSYVPCRLAGPRLWDDELDAELFLRVQHQ